MVTQSWLSKLLLPLGLLAIGTTGVAPSPDQNAEPPPKSAALLPADPVYKFPAGIWAEKEAFRKNGEQVIGTVIKPWLYLVNPQKNDGRLLYKFPEKDYNGTFAVNEIEDDVFYMLVGKWNASFVGYKGSMDVWTIDFRGQEYSKEPKIQKHQNIPDSFVLDGAAVLNKEKGLIIAGDSNAGSLYLIDTKKKTSRAVFTDELLRGLTDGEPQEKFGVNGIKIRNNGEVYFTVEGRGLLGKIAFDVDTGEPKKGAKIKTIFVQQGRLLDDFNFGPDGHLYLSAVDKGVLKLDEKNPKGVRQIVDLQGTNSCDFGRTPRDKNTLYLGRAVFDPTGVFRVKGAVDA